VSALSISHNKGATKTHLLLPWHVCSCSGAQYYRYRSRYGIDREFSLPFLLRYGIDPEYPKPLSDWKDVRRPVDDVLQYDGVTYFFSGTSYQEFDDSRLSVSLTQSWTPVGYVNGSRVGSAWDGLGHTILRLVGRVGSSPVPNGVFNALCFLLVLTRPNITIFFDN